MKILMLAWRDMKHPQKGGAEVVTDVYLSKLAKKGHNVTLFTADYEGAKQEETYHNYRIIRKGNKLTVSPFGLWYAYKNQDKYDIIIDQINTLPFFTPLLIKKQKRRAFFHQLCMNIWFYESPFPISLIGNIIERLYLKLYATTKTFVVSESTKNDLIKYAWMNPDNILVLENQINFTPIKNPKIKKNYFVFVGRLTKSKRVHDCIKALALLDKINNSEKNIVNEIENKENSRKAEQQMSKLSDIKINNNNSSNNNKPKLYIIGDGDDKYKNYLKDLTSKLNLSNRVIFTGKISNEERNEIMQRAIAILVTSVREGWGLIVTEANANGTLAITYPVEGLVDANKTGLITQTNTPESLAEQMDKISEDKELRNKLNKDSIDFAFDHCDWDDNVWRLERWLRK